MKLIVKVIIFAGWFRFLPVLVAPFADDQSSRLPFRPCTLPHGINEKCLAVNEINTDIKSAQ